MTDSNVTRDLLTRKLDRRALVGTTAVSALAVAAWPRHLGAAPVRQEGSTIIIGSLGEAFSLNPFIANDAESVWRTQMLFDEFVRPDPQTYLPTPSLAASWAIDGLTFTFAIQPNARFSDGTDVTAEDVKFTIEGILNPATASQNASKFTAIMGAPEFTGSDTSTAAGTPAVGTPFTGSPTGVSGIEAVDAKTLRITLFQPDAAFLYNLRFVSVVPKAQLEGQPLDQSSAAPFFQNPVGAGAYVFQSWNVGADFIATANPHYWDTGKPSIQSFTHRTIADASTLANALQSGEIDGSLYASPTLTEQLQAAGNLTIMVPPFNSPDGTVFNCRMAPFDNAEVRRAFAMAADVGSYVNDSLLGLGQAGLGPIAPGSWAYDTTLTPIPYDPEAARAVFEANGMIGQTYEMITNSGNILREDWCVRLQANLRDLGVNLSFTPIEWATMTERLTVTRDFQLSTGEFAGAIGNPDELFEQFHSTGVANHTGFSTPELDALLQQARQILDQEEAKPVWSQIQHILMREVPMHWAWYRPYISVVSNEYTGFTLSNLDGGIFRTLPDATMTDAAAVIQ
ncbi:MAG TPA: ABC transporter substrate-binding protein [Thermomicrobiales bacterium]|nr:ABC transporter substrate-binding protein [Thermomicrobiales bacterium]